MVQKVPGKGSFIILLSFFFVLSVLSVWLIFLVLPCPIVILFLLSGGRMILCLGVLPGASNHAFGAFSGRDHGEPSGTCGRTLPSRQARCSEN